jgi:hypothetical protein
MRLWLLILVLLQLPEPTIVAEWQGNTLVVIASPGSLYLVGGGYPDTYVGMEAVTLRDRNIDTHYDPTRRDALVLKNSSGQAILTLPIPDKPPEQWIVILPIVVH